MKSSKIRSNERGRILSVALAGFMLFSAAAGSATAADEAPVTPHAEMTDPLLAGMKATLKTRALNSDELDKLSNYLESHPNDIEAHLVLANAYNKMGMTEMYAEELEKVWRLSPKLVFYLIAAMKIRAGSDDHAGFDRLVDEAYKTHINDAKVLAKMGQLFQNNNQQEFAERYLKRAVELDPKDSQVLCLYCNTLFALRKYRELLAVTGPLKADPKTRALASLLDGAAWIRLNRPDKAVTLLGEAYAEAPGQAEVAEAYYDALVATGRRAQAIEPALMDLALQPPFSPHINVVKTKIAGVIGKASNEQLQAAISQVLRKLPPGNSAAFFYFALGDILDRCNRKLNAANCYNAGLAVDQSFGRAFMRLAHDLEILGGSPDRVIELYQQAYETTRNDYEVKARYERMKARMPAMDRDIAGKLKILYNNTRYR